MRLRLLLSLVLIAMGLPPAQAEESELLPFKSGLYADFRHILSRGAATAEVEIVATIRLPDEIRDRYPAIVIVHTIGGYQDANEGWHAAEFRKAGFATLTYRSAAAERLRSAPPTGPSAGQPWPSAVAEAYAALRLLAGHPRIDAQRIAIVGFSFGGEVAHLGGFERLRAALARDGLRFAAHVAYYPAGVYGAAAEAGAYSGAPMLMLLGEKDENLPLAKARAYLDYATNAAGRAPMEVSIYAGAHHAWTVPTLGAVAFYPQYPSTRKCPYFLLGPSPPPLLVEGRETPIDPGLLRVCLQDGRGYSMAYDAAARTRSTAETVAFLAKALRP